MIRVAVVDDMDADRGRLVAYLKRYDAEHGASFVVRAYSSSIDFLEEYRGDEDLIFLDIEMPGTSGMEAAHEIRQKDERVALIFVTNMAQYALEGYEVNAVDYILKPVRYEIFAQKLEKAFRFLEKHQAHDFVLESDEGVTRIQAEDVLYIEKDGNYLVYHTARQGDFRVRGTMRALIGNLTDLHFAEASSGCVINMDHIDRIQDDMVTVEGQNIPLSRRMKKAFVQKYMEFVTG